jgi:hypothetical protein
MWSVAFSPRKLESTSNFTEMKLDDLDTHPSLSTDLHRVLSSTVQHLPVELKSIPALLLLKIANCNKMDGSPVCWFVSGVWYPGASFNSSW